MTVNVSPPLANPESGSSFPVSQGERGSGSRRNFLSHRLEAAGPELTEPWLLGVTWARGGEQDFDPYSK